MMDFEKQKQEAEESALEGLRSSLSQIDQRIGEVESNSDLTPKEMQVMAFYRRMSNLFANNGVTSTDITKFNKELNDIVNG